MCGIIGYIGPKRASEILVDSLKRLEYRGYDSVGIAVYENNQVNIVKGVGMVEEVSNRLNFRSLNGHLGIGHTRWATHGSVTDQNAHPHYDCKKSVILVHNGVIENYLPLRSKLENLGHKFNSGTDSEVLAHLIEENLKSVSPKEAFLSALNQIEGSYAVVVIMPQNSKDEIYLAKKNSPLVIGLGKGDMFCSSDIAAALPYTKSFIILEDGDCAIISKDEYSLFDINGNGIARTQKTIDWNSESVQKGTYQHFMLKEIHDQPHALVKTLSSDLSSAKNLISKHKKIHILACGTSYHCALLFSYLLNEKGYSSQAFIASDYQLIAKSDSETLIIAISQSGETADVLSAIKYAKKHCSAVLSITNVVGSSITNLSDQVLFLNCGPEVAVAATKTFAAQMALAYSLVFGEEVANEIPSILERSLSVEEEIKKIAPLLSKSEHTFFIARGKFVPLALEGSLKFKEITYIHSEAYPGGELKHGTLSLISEGTPVIVLGINDESSQKLLGNLKEAKARGAKIFSITNDQQIISESHFHISLPSVAKTELSPFLLLIPLQMLAYYVSVNRGINPDRPRNLAKAVTVE